MNAFKRIFALILTLCMVLSYVPVSANAATTLTGTPTVPAGVSDATEPFPLSLMTQHGNSGGHFRIPAIVTLKDGTLVAAADARWRTYGSSDDTGNIDTVVSYSKDHGDTWEVTFANYFGGDTPYVEDCGSATYIDPGLATDGEKLYMIVDLFPGQPDGSGNCNTNATSATAYDDQGRMLLRENASTTDTSYYLAEYDDGTDATWYKIYAIADDAEQSGYTVDAYFNLYQDDTYVRNLFEYSTDSFIPVMTPHLYLTVGTFDANGVLTWSEPTMLNPALRTNANDSYYLVSPGRGIYTSDNILVFGAYGNATGEKASIIFYDGENWHRSTSSASSTSSENEIVELYDGTLRMFVRHADSTYAVQYIDWTPVYDADGNVTDYTPGTAVTTAAAAHNNTNITALSYSGTSDGKQVILVACPGSTAGAWERYNGKIFTFLVDPETNAMTLANTYEVNGTSDPYSYSCLTQLSDGTVGLLYEKGDSGNITYAEFTAEEITGLTFDENTNIFVDGSNNADSVAVTVVESSGVTHIHTESTTVASLTDTHVAYNIVCCTDAEDACTADINCTNTYTGKATVSIPLNGTFAEDANLKGFVVNADGSITDIFLVERNTQLDTLTFEVPHFSVVGVTLVADDDIVYTSEVDLTVKIGQTITIADDTGNYEASYAAAGLDDSIAAVEVSGTDTIVKTRSDAVTAIESGKSYLITTKSNQSPLTATSYSSTALKIDATAEDLWKFTGSGTSYQISQGSNYLNISSSAVTTSTTAQDLTVVYDEATGTWSIAYVNGSTNYYINNYGQSNTNAGVWTGLDDGSRWIIYELLSNTVGSTDITITGKSADVTSVVVGTTKYNITVVDEAVEVTLGVGETKTETLTGVAVSGDNSADADSAAIATVSWAGTAAATVLSDGTEVSLESCLFTFTKSGDNYVISGTTSDGTTVYLNHYSTTTNEIPLTTESNTVAISAGTGDQAEMFRLISQVDSTSSQGSNARTLHFHMEATTPYWNRCGNASHAACHEYLYRPVQDGETSSTEIPGYVRITTVDEIQDGGQYLIAAKNNAGNWYVLNPANSTTKEDYVAQVGGGTTTITIEGVATGVTRVDVGGTIYKITVGDVEYVNLYANQSVTYTIEGVAYTQDDVSAELDDTVATVTVAGNTTYILGEEVTDLANLSDGLYVLVSNKNGKILTNVPVDNDLGLVDTTNSPAVTAVWRLTKASDNSDEFYVQDLDGNYLTMGSGSASVGSDANSISLWYENSHWTIRPYSDFIYLGDSGGYGIQADGWADQNAYSDESRWWSIYKVNTDLTTEVTIKGVAKGETTALIGDTRYYITVDELVKDVTVYVGQTKTITDTTGNHEASYTGNGLDTSVATVTVNGEDGTTVKTLSEPVTAIESGKQYVIYNNRAQGVLNNTTYTDTAWGTTFTGLHLNGAADANTTEIWTIEGADGVYTIMDEDGQYVNISDHGSSVGASSQLNLSYNAEGYWTISKDNYYLGDESEMGTVAGGWNSDGTDYDASTDAGSKWTIYEVISTSEPASTDITIQGVSEGETSVLVGYTRYNITVEKLVVDVTVKVGETVTHTIVGEAYSDSDVTTTPDTSKVTMTVTPHAQANWNTPVASIRSGAKYLIVVNNRTAGNNATNNVLTPDAVTDTNYLALSGDYETSDVYWIIEEVPGEDDTYYVKTADGNYLTIGSGSAGTVAGETKLTLKYTATDSGGYWMLGQGNQYLNQYGGVGNDYAAGYGSQTDTNSQWELYEYIEEDYTDVTFSGLTVGDTTAVVGYTNYNIHVVENVVDVSLYVGETKTETINGVSLTAGNNYAQDSWNIAAVSWADGSERTVTAELLDTSGTATGTIDLAAAEYTFTRNDDGTYTIKDSTDTYYLNVTGIPHGTTEAALDLTMNSDGTVNFNVSDDTSKYLCVYRSGQYSMCWSSGKALDEYPDDCAFYIYAPVAAGETSSAEIPGYKKVTSLDDITSGEGYLITFEGADGNVYCVCFTSTGTSAYNNMARIETELVSSATAVTITGRNVGTTSVTVGGTVYNITVLPHVKTLTIEIGTSVTTPVTGTVTDDDITAFNTAHSGTVTVARDGDNLVFNGVAEGKAEYVLGNRKYIISVTPDLADTDDSDYVGGESGTQGEGQMITGLIISTNTSYDLNLADDVTGTITWESSDTSIFTVDENGTVTTTGTAGEAYVTVYVDGVVYQTIPVKVLAVNNDDTDNLRVIDVYNEEVLNCTAYYSYQAGALAEFPQGYQIYIKHNKSETDLITFFATPNDGYALTYIYDTAGTYFHTVSNENHSDYTTDGTHSDSLGMVTGGYQSLHDQLIAYAVNNAGAATADQIHAMLADAVLYRVDGAFFHSYSVNYGTLDANTHFVAEKLPEVTKTINGVLGASGMQVDWKPYVEGMYAKVGEYVYFTINITIDAPIEWEVDSSGNAVTDEYGPLAALEYNFSEGDPDAMLTDNLEGAYFYTKELDGQDGDQSGNGVADDDGYIADPSLQKTQQAVTAEMNRGWTAEEIAAGQRVLEYYVVYEIQPEDEGQTITNMVDLSYIYRTTYSYGATQATGHAEASMNILGLPMGDVVVDFGLPVTITGVNAGHLANQFDEAATNAAVGSCNYGYVTITDNNDGTWSVTYTPTEVFQGYDVVYLMGADGNLKNYFRVRPASTVYYEESFAEYTDGSADTGWTGEDAAVAGEQQFQEAAQTGKNNFGFDDKYAAETGMSNGTAAVSPDGASGNTATFTFTGSGFDLYANTDTTTGIVSVLLYRVTGTDDAQTETLTKFYQVVTANKSGNTTATDGQDVTTNSLPIVSATDLEHGTYKVVIKPSRSGGEFRLDGFRVYNTLADSDAYYPVDEQNVTFTELRDEVLTALTVDETTTAAQVYSASQTTSGGTVLYLTEDTDSDLLENGPKNELWLSDSETLAFTLGTGVNYAQLGLKAPNGEVTCVVTTTYGDKTVTETYTIKSSTDMFYDIPSYTTSTTETTTGDDGSTTVTTTDVTTVSGATVTIQVTSGMLSVTKLKTSASEATTTVTTTTTSDGTASTNTTTNIPAYSGPVFASALSKTGEEQIVAVLNVLYGTDDTTNDGTTDDGPTDDNTGDNTVESNVTRIYGENRFETSFKVADELKTLLELEKFDTIIIASGTNFADALSGSFLAAKMNAPILLAYNEEYDQLTADYIHANLSEGGTVYILGGTAAVSATMEAKLEGLNVKRLAGANRFETNILILKEAGTHVDQAMLVCTGTNFADSLSASATGAPILLVWNESGELLDCQKEFLAEHTEYSGARFRIVGGNDAVSREMEKLFQSYGTTERIYGENRFETSAALAELYFGDKVENAVLAYAWNYPDGLCGGPLAHAWGAPLILTMTGYEDAAVAYATESGIVSGIVLGGDGLISNEAVRDIYAMDPDGEIIVK